MLGLRMGSYWCPVGLNLAMVRLVCFQAAQQLAFPMAQKQQQPRYRRLWVGMVGLFQAAFAAARRLALDAVCVHVLLLGAFGRSFRASEWIDCPNR